MIVVSLRKFHNNVTFGLTLAMHKIMNPPYSFQLVDRYREKILNEGLNLAQLCRNIVQIRSTHSWYIT